MQLILEESLMIKRKLQRTLFGKLTKAAARILSKSYPQEVVDRIVGATEREYESIIPRLPYVGGLKNIFTLVIPVNGWLVSFYRGVKGEGIDKHVAVYIAREVFKVYIDMIPKWLGTRIGKLAFTNLGQNHFKKQAERSQKKEFSEDWVYTFSATKSGGGISGGLMEFSECAVHKFYDAEGVPELKEFCNFADPIYGTRFQMGVNADRTFAQGCSSCQLSFNNGRETKTPDNIQEMIKKAEKILDES